MDAENRSGSSCWQVSIVDNPRCKHGLGLVVARLLIAALYVMAEAPGKRVLRIGGAIVLQLQFGPPSLPHRLRRRVLRLTVKRKGHPAKRKQVAEKGEERLNAN